MANNGGSGWVKWLVVLAIVAGAVAGVWYVMKNRNSEPEYQLGTVSRGDLIQTVTASGQLNPVVNIQVGSQISGRISKINVDFNSEVKSNQVIAEIDPASYQAAVLRSEADLANAKANLALTRVQADRADSLFTNNLISASDHDTAKAQKQQADAQVQSAEANLANAKVDLSRCTIYAPVDGVVISRNVDVGQTVAASFNTPTLFVIANDLTKMQIDALVSEADIGGVVVGQNVNFTVDAFPYRTFHGKVSQIRYGALTNQNVVNYDCVVAVDNSDNKLLPGMTASVSVIIAERDNVIKIPNAALRFRPPEMVAAETNSAPKMAANNARPPGGEGGGGQEGAVRKGGAGAGAGEGGPGSGRPRREGAGGGQGGPGGSTPGGQPKPRPERSGPRTVYVFNSSGSKVELTQAKVKTGISDGVNTEVVEGLKEGDQVVTGLLAAQGGAGNRTPNPLGGGFRRF
jgi:HlyD family secretion protein